MSAKAPTADNIPPLNAVDRPDENGETRAGRMARIDAEQQILGSTVPGSLADKLRKLLGQGLYVDEDSATLDSVIARVAAVQIRAVALALDGGIRCESVIDSDGELSSQDSAIALLGIASTLEIGMDLAGDLRRASAEVATGGAS